MVGFRVGGEAENQQKEETCYEGGLQGDAGRIGFGIPLCEGDSAGGETRELSGFRGRGDARGSVPDAACGGADGGECKTEGVDEEEGGIAAVRGGGLERGIGGDNGMAGALGPRNAAVGDGEDIRAAEV